MLSSPASLPPSTTILEARRSPIATGRRQRSKPEEQAARTVLASLAAHAPLFRRVEDHLWQEVESDDDEVVGIFVVR